MTEAPQAAETTPATTSLSNRDALKRLCEQIKADYEAQLVKKAGPFPQHKPRASGIGVCAREMYHQVANWEQKPPFDAHVMAILRRGSDTEELIDVPQLNRLGFKVIGGQMPLKIDSRDGSKIICTGHIDGRLEFLDEETGQTIRPVFDVKTLSPNLFPHVQSAADLLENKWLRRWVYQLLLYMYAHNEPHGFYLIDDRAGHWKVIELYLEDYLELCEELLTRCETVVNALEAGEPPDYHNDAAVCRECWCYQAGVCSPPLDFEAQGIKILALEELEAALRRMDELKEAAQEYAALDRSLKDGQKKRGPGRYLCGEFLIDTKQQQYVTTEIPAEIATKLREQHGVTKQRTTTTWKRLGDNELSD